ncbi:MAG: PD40 domain-containing protein [Deltaproteobacteria bacterium]|nr:PD40 domain-containing protein [Deltaproteobacteria bacterium]
MKPFPVVKFFLCSLLASAVFLPLRAKADIKIEYFNIVSGRLVFAATKGVGKSDIYVLDFQKLAASPVIETSGNDTYPSWSPDGTEILYESDESGNLEIYIARSDGSNVRNLTRNPATDKNPHWSPDGKRIVFTSSRLGKGENLFIMNTDGTQPLAITNNSNRNSVPKWSPRGNEVIYSTDSYWPGWDIVLYEIEGKRSMRMTNGYNSFCRADWHPNGGKFVFSYGSGKDIDLWIQTKGGAPEQLTSLAGREYDAVWDNDGKRIFFVSESKPGASDYHLFLIDVETKLVSQITSGTMAIRYPSWTPYPEVNFAESNAKSTAPSPDISTDDAKNKEAN